MDNWADLDGRERDRDVLVVGNGPSRKSRAAEVRAFWRDRWGVVVGCNAYWREPLLPPADYLVCYEAFQAQAAMHAAPAGTTIVLPDQSGPSACQVDQRSVDPTRRVVEIAPLRGSGDWEAAMPEGWWPTDLAVGNLSGILAYQLAMVMRPRAIYLIGVDCCGLTRVGSDQVVLSAIGDDTPGYGPSSVPARAIRPGRHAMPEGWDQYRSLWRALTRAAEAGGIPTYRVVDAGALDWIEVKHPCPESRTAGQPAWSRRS